MPPASASLPLKRRNRPHLDLTVLVRVAGGSICADAEANEQLYGEGAEAGAILGGRVRPPQAFQPLYEELAAVLAGEPIEPQGLDTPDDARVSLRV